MNPSSVVRRLIQSVAVATSGVFLSTMALAGASGPLLPSQSNDAHLGVASCASAVCHGSVQAFPDSTVRRNEYAWWQTNDPHAQAYQVLYNDASKAIARKLGLSAAHEADMCLDCHADNVPVDQRGEKFQLSDGISCEACHGGAERWLSAHTAPDASHAGNLELGLYPTEAPVQRARLCLSCHLGGEDKLITHRIMGAGHPRISFELDTFTELQRHYDYDPDYSERKGVPDGVRDWAVGQATAARNMLGILLDPQHGRDGLFPELVVFDCHACHHAMSKRQWGRRDGTGLGPGVVRFNDAYLLMLRHIMSVVNPGIGQRLAEQTLALHRATTVGRQATHQAGENLLASVDAAGSALQAYRFAGDALDAILGSLIEGGIAGEYRDYAGAEQASMAVQGLIAAFERSGALSPEQIARLTAEMDESMFPAMDDEENYRPSVFVGALRKIQAAAP
ncbi:MAG: hypothetical protein E2O56_05765 [Gammaproteobacteria bacterium]|nr:MAG: hypothetical protein E2O56_05765 [Gammaproteobacteria bacterium]